LEGVNAGASEPVAAKVDDDPCAADAGDAAEAEGEAEVTRDRRGPLAIAATELTSRSRAVARLSRGIASVWPLAPVRLEASRPGGGTVSAGRGLRVNICHGSSQSAEVLSARARPDVRPGVDGRRVRVERIEQRDVPGR
jgi:hypothetical protein